MIRFLKLVGVLFVFLVGLLFAFRNTAPVQLSYLWGTVQVPISYVALGGCVVGLVLGVIGCGATMTQLLRANRRLKRESRDVHAEVNSLRKAPFTDSTFNDAH